MGGLVKAIPDVAGSVESTGTQGTVKATEGTRGLVVAPIGTQGKAKADPGTSGKVEKIS
jgi:hypothetical protein